MKTTLLILLLLSLSASLVGQTTKQVKPPTKEPHIPYLKMSVNGGNDSITVTYPKTWECIPRKDADTPPITVVCEPKPASSVPATPPKMVCWDGWDTTKDDEQSCKKLANHDWIVDQTGKSMPGGDGCKIVTCGNAACSLVSMDCAYHPVAQTDRK